MGEMSDRVGNMLRYVFAFGLPLLQIAFLIRVSQQDQQCSEHMRRHRRMTLAKVDYRTLQIFLEVIIRHLQDAVDFKRSDIWIHRPFSRLL